MLPITLQSDSGCPRKAKEFLAQLPVRLAGLFLLQDVFGGEAG
jgi:hypothetical protein